MQSSFQLSLFSFTSTVPLILCFYEQVYQFCTVLLPFLSTCLSCLRTFLVSTCILCLLPLLQTVLDHCTYNYETLFALGLRPISDNRIYFVREDTQIGYIVQIITL